MYLSNITKIKWVFLINTRKWILNDINSADNCTIQIISGNTSHLMGHIKKVHSEMFSTGSVPGAQTTAKSQESKKFKNRETSTNGRLSQDKQELIDNTLCKLIASKTISPSVVEDELFQTFVELLNPRLETIWITHVTFLKFIINCSECFFSNNYMCKNKNVYYVEFDQFNWKD